MTRLRLNVEKQKCTGSCPLPLSVMPNMVKGINKVDYDEQSCKVVIEFDGKKISKKEVIAAVTKMQYKVKTNGK